MLYLLGKLRQACNHPMLVKGGAFGRPPPATAAEVAAAKRLPADRLSALLAAATGGDAQCPVCGDVPEAPTVTACTHVYCRQCATAQLEGAGGDGEFNCHLCAELVRPAGLFSLGALHAAHGDAAEKGAHATSKQTLLPSIRGFPGMRSASFVFDSVGSNCKLLPFSACLANALVAFALWLDETPVCTPPHAFGSQQ